MTEVNQHMGFSYVFNTIRISLVDFLKGVVKMPRVIPSAPARPASVDVSKAGTRVVTMVLPKRWTEAERNAKITEKGQQPKAICDLTGEPIFADNNVNEVHNPLREADGFHGFTVSTTVMRELKKLADQAA